MACTHSQLRRGDTAILDHVKILPSGQGGSNTCAIYFQAVPYGTHLDGLYSNALTHGIMIAPPMYNSDYLINNGASNDGSIWSHIDINVSNPFVSWIGGINTVSDSTMYSGAQPITYNPSTCPLCTRVGQQGHSFSLYQLPNHAGTNASEMGQWLITNVYDEVNNGGGLATYGAIGQLGGNSHTMVDDTITISVQAGLWPYVVDANASTVSLAANGLNTIVNYGNGNTFTQNGVGAVLDLGYATKYSNSNTTQYGYKPYNPTATRQQSANKVCADFLQTGSTAGSWYQCADDLFLTPDDFQNKLSPVGTSLVVDSTVPITGKYLLMASPGTFSIGTRSINDGGDVFGQRWPIGKGTIYIALKAGDCNHASVEFPVRGRARNALDCQSNIYADNRMGYL